MSSIDTIKRFQNGGPDIYCFADTAPVCRELLAGGAPIIQFRDKTSDDETFETRAKEMIPMIREYENAVLIVNDRADIAIAIDADGVHVGQGDEDYRSVIRRVPEGMIVGVTVKTPGQAKAAEEAGAAYVGAGAVFPSPTKPDSLVIGLEGLREVVKSVRIPVVAIGGISLENVGDVVRAGARYCAVISGINDSGDIAGRVGAFRKEFGRLRG